MKKVCLLLFTFLLSIIFISIIFPDIFLPVDILHYFPSFQSNNFIAPKNSLLADPVYQFEPWRYFAKTQILNGNFPLWNNLNGKGAPFFANPQTAVLFPLNLFYYILPIKISSYLIPFLKLYLFGFFSYLYFKSLKVSSEISLIGALTISSSGFFILWLLWPHTNVFLFLPLFLFLIEKIREESKITHRYYIAFALAFCFAIFGGHPETLFHITLIVLFYCIFRLHQKKNKLIGVIISFVFGTLLASILLIPFFEYLLNSFALQTRTSISSYNFLPIVSFTSNIVPFILGAPHLPFYKPISNSTNFQEYTGGYVGIIVLLVAIFGIIKLKKNSIIIFWALTVIISWLTVYGIFPFSLISLIPLLRSADNNRLVAFSAFGLITLFALSLNQLLQKRATSKILINKRLFLGALTSSFIFLFGLLIISFSKIHATTKIEAFTFFLFQHISSITISTAAFLLIFHYLAKKNKIKTSWSFILFIPIFFQTTFFFWNYNPFAPKSDYYPKNELIAKMQSFPKGTYFEVGNPSIPANTNLIYSLENAENNDAIQLNSYKTAFDKAFPIKNQWKIVDAVNKKKLDEFGISYILSDYNLNYDRQAVQPKYTNLIGPLINQMISINFVAKSSNLREIRILPANYNRNNTCIIYLKILDQKTHENKINEQILCNKFLDKMYFTDEINTKLDVGKSYTIQISSVGATGGNSISFWGNKKFTPYVNLFYYNGNHDYEFIAKENNVQIWKIPKASDINLEGSYKTIVSLPFQSEFIYESNKDQFIQIKKTNYPGWIATVDGNEANIISRRPLINFFIPKGKHIVILSYKPLSFFVGKIISSITLLVVIIYLLRNEIKQRGFKKIIESLNKKSQSFNKKRLLTFKTVVFIFLLILSLVSTLITIMFILPQSIVQPQTTVVNWLTVHNHSLTLDYIRYLILSFFIPIIVVGGWILILWKKNH